MRFFRLLAIGVVLLVLAGAMFGMACTGAQGEQGPPGADGVGVETIVSNGDGTYSVLLSDGREFTTDNLTGSQGPQGEKGDTGDAGPQGLQGIPGDSGPNMIIAMGVVDVTGSLTSGYNVTSSVWIDQDGPLMDCYEITLNVAYTTSYVTIVTPILNNLAYFAYFAHGPSGGERLRVAFYTGSSVWVPNSFSFVVLECPD
jgi:hypothetical protein